VTKQYAIIFPRSRADFFSVGWTSYGPEVSQPSV
jgi:hypothetical protein